MAPEKIEELLKRIDSVVGTPDRETEQERTERRKMMIRDAERRRIRKAAIRPT